MVRKGFKNLAIGMAACMMLSQSFPALALENTEGHWQMEEKAWTFVNAKGEKQKGWIVSEGAWYLLKEDSGTLQSGWWKSPSGKWFFFNTAHDGSFGKLCTGWQWIDGYCYYFEDQDSAHLGELLTAGTKDGYSVDEDGRWVENGKPVYEQGKGLLSKEDGQQVAGVSRSIPEVLGVNRSSSGGSGRSSGGSSGRSSGSGSGSVSNSTNNQQSSTEKQKEDAEKKAREEKEKKEQEKKDQEKKEQEEQEKKEVFSVLEREHSGLVNLGFDKYIVLSFKEGRPEDYKVEVDGTDITEALTPIDTAGKLWKWESTVVSPKNLTISKKDGGEEKEILSLNAGEAQEAPARSFESSGDLSLVIKGKVTKEELNYPSVQAGRERTKESRTTFDLSEQEEKGIPITYYFKAFPVDYKGENNGKPIKYEILAETEEQKKWFEKIDSISSLSEGGIYSSGNKNASLKFTKEAVQMTKHGELGVITIPAGQENLKSKGWYQVKIHSSYDDSTITIPLELVSQDKLVLRQAPESSTPKQGETIRFMANAPGSEFGEPSSKLVLKKPDGSSQKLEYLKDFYYYDGALLLYGKSKDEEGSLLTDQAGQYVLTVKLNGYGKIKQRFEVFAGEAKEEQDEKEEKARQKDGEKDRGSFDAISHATSREVLTKKKPNLSDLPKLGEGEDKYLALSYDLLSNALLLREMGISNPDADLVAARFLRSRGEKYFLPEEGEKFYDFTTYFAAYKDKAAKGGETLSLAEFLTTAEAVRRTPSSFYRILEDGSLSKELSTEYLTGKKAPEFYGGVAQPGEEMVLETKDEEYLQEGKLTLYLDKQSYTTKLSSGSYAKQFAILKEEGKIIIYPKAFKEKGEGKHTLILVREGYQTLELPLSFEEAVEKQEEKTEEKKEEKTEEKKEEKKEEEKTEEKKEEKKEEKTEEKTEEKKEEKTEEKKEEKLEEKKEDEKSEKKETVAEEKKQEETANSSDVSRGEKENKKPVGKEKLEKKKIIDSSSKPTVKKKKHHKRDVMELSFPGEDEEVVDSYLRSLTGISVNRIPYTETLSSSLKEKEYYLERDSEDRRSTVLLSPESFTKATNIISMKAEGQNIALKAYTGEQD
nr:hypothetical protein [uncultured Oribacterium sp.]